MRRILGTIIGIAAVAVNVAAAKISPEEKQAWEKAEADYRAVVHAHGVNSRPAIEARQRLDRISADLEGRYPDISNKPDPRKAGEPNPEPVRPQAGPAPDHRPNGSLP